MANPLNSLRFLSSMVSSILQNNNNLQFSDRLNLQIIGIALTILTDKILPKLLVNNQNMENIFEQLERTLKQFETTLNNINLLQTGTTTSNDGQERTTAEYKKPEPEKR